MRCRPLRHRLRRLHLDDEVDRAHVDAELERRGRDEAGQRPRLEQVLDDDALLARQGAVVGAGDLACALFPALLRLLPREVVQPQGDALRRAAVVDEDERRAVLADEAQQLRVDRRPDAAPRRLAAGDRCRARAARRARPWTPRARGCAGRAACARRRRRRCSRAAGPTRKRATSSRGRCVADRPMRCTSRPACSASRSSVTARCAPRLVCATAWISSTITHCVPANSSRACEVSIRYSDSGVVMRMSGGLRSIAAPLALRRVAGAHADAHVGADAAQRRPQVALDVVAERLERRDVDQPQRALARRRPASGSATKRSSAHRKAASVLPEPVGAEIERVGAGGDGRPRPATWRRRGLREGAREPLADLRRERDGARAAGM